jgi:DNA sulfur modification protein DndE
VLQTNRIRISSESTQWLRNLKSRTGLTPNIISRFAICLSLSKPKDRELFSTTSDGLEFNSYTLFGNWETLMISLIKQEIFSCTGCNLIEESEVIEGLRYHLMRGAKWLNARVKCLNDLASLKN